MSQGTLSAIHVHPIKSCHRIELSEIEVSATGLTGDREWQVVTEAGDPVTQRQHKILALVEPQLVEGGLRISAPGHGSIEVERPQTNTTTVRGLLGDEVACGEAGAQAATFFSELLATPARLSVITPATNREVGLFKNRVVSFVDAAPVVVTNTASLADLRNRSSEEFGMERFRPNLVIDTDRPWAEDTWHEFSIGETDLVGTLPWPRCVMPQIDQDTAQRHKEPALVLRAHRWCEQAPGYPAGLRAALEGKALFGMGASIDPVGAILRIGDPLMVQSTMEPTLAPPGGHD
jgi:uncharacterized protein YcbX